MVPVLLLPDASATVVPLPSLKFHAATRPVWACNATGKTRMETRVPTTNNHRRTITTRFDLFHSRTRLRDDVTHRAGTMHAESTTAAMLATASEAAQSACVRRA